MGDWEMGWLGGLNGWMSGLYGWMDGCFRRSGTGANGLGFDIHSPDASTVVVMLVWPRLLR